MISGSTAHACILLVSIALIHIFIIFLKKISVDTSFIIWLCLLIVVSLFVFGHWLGFMYFSASLRKSCIAEGGTAFLIGKPLLNWVVSNTITHYVALQPDCV